MCVWGVVCVCVCAYGCARACVCLTSSEERPAAGDHE